MRSLSNPSFGPRSWNLIRALKSQLQLFSACASIYLPTRAAYHRFASHTHVSFLPSPAHRACPDIRERRLTSPLSSRAPIGDSSSAHRHRSAFLPQFWLLLLRPLAATRKKILFETPRDTPPSRQRGRRFDEATRESFTRSNGGEATPKPSWCVPPLWY